MNREHTILPHPTPQDQRVEDAYARLQLARQHTRGTLTAIRREIVAKTDFNSMVRAKPYLFLGLAFFTGFLLAHRR